jgi:hypothetical protein
MADTGDPETGATMMDAIAGPIEDFFANPLVSTGLTLVGIAVVALWLAAAWWAYQDAARRSESTLAAFFAAAWIVVSTPLMLPFALAVYGLARPQLTASDHRSRALVRQLALTASEGPMCASCSSPIESSWLRCPACSNWLAAPCRGCGAWSARDLEACPFCGSEDHAAPAVEPVREPVAAAVPANPSNADVPVGPAVAVSSRVAMGLGWLVGGSPAGAASPAAFAAAHAMNVAEHGTAAAGVSPAAAVMGGAQERVASSARPFSYATSRDISSASS